MKRSIARPVVGLVIAALGILASMAAHPHEPTGSKLPDKLPQNGEELSRFLDKHSCEIGFFARNLGNGRSIERFADRPVCLASIVKLFCLTELYRQKHEKALDLNQELEVANQGSMSLTHAADLMIGKSDNAATQALAEFLGRDNVNRIPSLLGIQSMSDNILPSENDFAKMLDRRISGGRTGKTRMPQHGTARGMAQYFELLLNNRVISEAISADLVAFLSAHPMPYSNIYAGRYEFVGKGGNIVWTRPPKHYSMMGWALLVRTPSGNSIVLCVWGEWFPESMTPDQQSEFLKYVTDSVIAIEES